MLYPVTKERGACPQFQVVDVAVQGLVHSEYELRHALTLEDPSRPAVLLGAASGLQYSWRSRRSCKSSRRFLHQFLKRPEPLGLVRTCPKIQIRTLPMILQAILQFAKIVK